MKNVAVSARGKREPCLVDTSMIKGSMDGRSPSGHVLLRIWGHDKKGNPINLLLTCLTVKIARSAAALFKYGARARFWISS